nr:reticulon-like protein B8 isoform X6 [Malus domestica]
MFCISVAAMPEKITTEDLVNNIAGTLADTKLKSSSLFGEETSSSVTTQSNRLFGRQKPVHHILGGGKSADVLLWRNKKISASVLTAATVVWVLFEWLNYHFLTLVGFALVVGMLVQFLWSNFSGMISSSSPSKVPRLVLPEDLFVNIAVSIGAQINRGLAFVQDVAYGGNVKQFLKVLLLLTHCRFCMRDTMIRLTALYTRSSGCLNTITRSWMPVSSARYLKESRTGRSMNRFI